MPKHIFVSKIELKKANDGSWFVSKVFTSEGNFDIGKESNQGLNLQIITNAVNEIKSKVLPQIQDFIVSEVEEEKKKKS